MKGRQYLNVSKYEKKELSKEVQLLYMMTNTFVYEGMRGHIIEFSDEIKDRPIKEDICVLLAKVLCYEQIIEQMVESLYIQNLIWKRVKLKNIHYKHEKIDEYYIKIEKLDLLEDFDEARRFQCCCNTFRKKRNNLAHRLLQNRIAEVFEKYSDLEELYEEIFEIYQEQNFLFVNRIIERLANPMDFLIEGRNYSGDIIILSNKARKIKRKNMLSDDDKDEIANLHQIYCFLTDVQTKGYSQRKLLFKHDLVGISYYINNCVEKWLI